jgi:restriction endonuclease
VDAVVDLLDGAARIADSGLDDVLLTNLRAVQRAAGIRPVEALAYIEREIDTRAGRRRARFANFAVEMETGTGKTYVYLRTALELARLHRLQRFIVVVPSVAIREGVIKTLQITREHFAALYPDVPYRYHAYDSRRLARLRSFVSSTNVELMVMTIDAFNKASNVMRQPNDRLQGEVPLHMVQDVRPVLILDEPQNMESDLSVQSLADLHPQLALRYSATHRNPYALIHRLSPAEAHRRGLVKRIEVASVADERPVDREAALSAQIRRTIEAHMERKAWLEPRGIKVLSLFFVDRVSSYTAEDGLVRRLFDHHYEELRSQHSEIAALPAQSVRAAYFAEKRRRGGHREKIDSRSGRSAADEAAYDLIMRDKERLLSLEEPVAFIFSHSALREGWDNPNVFQICTLAHSRSDLKKRQEIGRGVRLPVDQSGRRVHDPDIGVLTVVANDSYETYVAGLQSELLADLEDHMLPPQPAKAGPAASRRGVEPREAVVDPDRWQVLDTERLLREAVRRLDAACIDGPAHDATRGALPNLVDLVAELVGRRAGAARLTRRTILALLRRTRHREALLRRPLAVASAAARALVQCAAAQLEEDPESA